MNDIHIIIDGSHFLVGIMKVAWEFILSIFHVEMVFYLLRKLLYGWWKPENIKKKNKKKTKKKQQKNKNQILYLPVEWFRPAWASCPEME